MADSAASTQSRPRRAASKKRRQAAVSTDTENKLARAARSAQRLAQLSDMSRDDSTLDLFPDDPTRATLEAMNIDVRQGTLHGFELPDVVLAAVGAIDADGVSLETKAARRAPRVAKSDEPAPVNGQLIGLEIDETALSQTKFAAQSSGDEASNEPTREAAAPLTSAMAAATVARSVTALRQAAERSNNEVEKPASTSGSAKPAVPSQRFAATFVKASTAAREAGTTETAPADSALTPSDVAASSADATAAGKSSGDATACAAAVPPSAASANANSVLNAAASRETQRSAAASAALRAATPELDRARATAFADTVDAMYGVISDQRRAATDHSRRMKWMLSIVVGALLVTVAIGVTQTVLLMRLTRETTAQQHRIEQLMQNQQAAMANLLDAHIAAANAAAASAASSATAASADPQQTVETAHAGRAARTRRPHKLASISSH